jgi:uroporphyrinogen decarboxylase
MATQFMKLGADGVWFGDDWGTQNGLFMSPSVWRELIKPEQARMYNAVKELNGIVFQHSCGCIEAIVGDLIEIGMDVWHPAQPCNNLALLKQKYGNKMCFMGAIDSQYVLPLGSTEEVREEVRRRIKELGKDGGYIPLPSHEIPFPKENWEAMIDEIKKIKKYPT